MSSLGPLGKIMISIGVFVALVGWLVVAFTILVVVAVIATHGHITIT